MARSIERLRLVASGVSAGLTKMWAEYSIEDDGLKERNEPMKFKGVDYARPIGEIWQETKAAVVAKERL